MVAKANVTTGRVTKDAMMDSGIVPESRRATELPTDASHKNPRRPFPPYDRRNQAHDTYIPITGDVAEASQGESGSNAVDEWRKDENSPFSNFARAYLAIKPGKGNSYAKTKAISTESKHHENMASTGGSPTELKRFNIFSWSL